MSFEWPVLLVALALVPVAVVRYLATQRRRRAYAVRFTNLDLLANVAREVPGWRRHLPPALALLAATALLVSLARPHAVLATPREDATVVLTTDVSGSMQAADVEPSRMEAARSSARELVERLPDRVRLGLVAFDHTPDVLVSPTTDRGAAGRAIDGLVPRGGTAMGDALVRSIDMVRPGERVRGEDERRRSPAAVLLLSDGANTSGATRPLEAAERARELGVPITTVALGTPEGRIGVAGASRSVPPDPETLRAVASTSGGRFFSAPDAEALDSIYTDLGSRIATVPERQEVTFAFAGLGLGLLTVGGMLSMRWFGRLP